MDSCDENGRTVTEKMAAMETARKRETARDSTEIASAKTLRSARKRFIIDYSR